MKHLEPEQAMIAVRLAVDQAGTQSAFAAQHGLSPQFVNDIMKGRKELSKAILDAVGLERVVTYRRKVKAS